MQTCYTVCKGLKEGKQIYRHCATYLSELFAACVLRECNSSQMFSLEYRPTLHARYTSSILELMEKILFVPSSIWQEGYRQKGGKILLTYTHSCTVPVFIPLLVDILLLKHPSIMYTFTIVQTVCIACCRRIGRYRPWFVFVFVASSSSPSFPRLSSSLLAPASLLLHQCQSTNWLS